MALFKRKKKIQVVPVVKAGDGFRAVLTCMCGFSQAGSPIHCHCCRPILCIPCILNSGIHQCSCGFPRRSMTSYLLYPFNSGIHQCICGFPRKMLSSYSLYSPYSCRRMELGRSCDSVSVDIRVARLDDSAIVTVSKMN